jgi:serine/threonine-protein kinase HipA
MNIKALAIHIGAMRAGILFQYAASAETGREDRPVVTRFVADAAFADAADAPIVSTSFLAETVGEQRALWRRITSAPFNGR